MQQPIGRASERNEALIDEWKHALARDQEKVQKEGRMIVFTDESGLSRRSPLATHVGAVGADAGPQLIFDWETPFVIAAPSGIPQFQNSEQVIQSQTAACRGPVSLSRDSLYRRKEGISTLPDPPLTTAPNHD